jgi:hypothetical protein
MADALTMPAGQLNEGSHLSQAERVVDIFIAPSIAFHDLLRSTSWWLPFLLASLLSFASAYTIDKRVGFSTVVQNVLRDTPAQEERLASLEPKQRNAQLRGMGISYRYATYASPLFILIFSAIGALVLWASFNFGLGAKTTYGQMFAVWMYASLPRLATSLILIVTLWFGGNAEGFNLKNPVGTNAAFYLQNASQWLRTLLTFFDLVGIWTLALLILGTSIVARVTRGSAAAVILGWWFLILVVSVALAAFTG